MKQLTVADQAPDFALGDHQGKIYRLSEVLQRSNALLVFNIGFA